MAIFRGRQVPHGGQCPTFSNATPLDTQTRQFAVISLHLSRSRRRRTTDIAIGPLLLMPLSRYHDYNLLRDVMHSVGLGGLSVPWAIQDAVSSKIDRLYCRFHR